MPRDLSINSYFQLTSANIGKRKAGTDNSAALTSSLLSLVIPISPPPIKRQKMAAADSKQARHLDYTDLPSDWLTTASTETRDPQHVPSKLQITYHQGDMLEQAPKGCLLIHACNTQGAWGSGIAKAFKGLYPKAYAAYRAFCTKEHSISNPVPTGTTQLLAPCDEDRFQWIGCLFTSAKYGKAKDKPDVIVHNTIKAMQMLLELVSQTEGITVIRMCKINSGKFAVPWEDTVDALASIELKAHWRASVEVWEP
jgi:ADP-ribose 1''-phosphate phosphatase